MLPTQMTVSPDNGSIRISFAEPPSVTELTSLRELLKTVTGVGSCVDYRGRVLVAPANCFFPPGPLMVNIRATLGLPEVDEVVDSMHLTMKATSGDWWVIETDRKHDFGVITAIESHVNTVLGQAYLSAEGYNIHFRCVEASHRPEYLENIMRTIIAVYYRTH